MKLVLLAVAAGLLVSCGGGGGDDPPTKDYVPFDGAREYTLPAATGAGLTGAKIRVTVADLGSKAQTCAGVRVFITSDDGTFNNTEVTATTLTDCRIVGTVVVNSVTYGVVIQISADGGALSLILTRADKPNEPLQADSTSYQVTVVPSVAVAVAPTTATLAAGAQQQFTATVTGTTNTAVTWSATGGTVTQAGLYTAGTTAGSYTVTATSQVDSSTSGAATVTVQAAARWPQQFGATPGDGGMAVAVDSSGYIYVTGYTNGSFGSAYAGGDDAFVAKFDSAGNQLWVKQFGTSANDASVAVALDGSGGVVIAGGTSGSLGGPLGGITDAFVARYDSAGGQLWLQQFGTTVADYAWGVAVDGAGNAYVTGYTYGNLGNGNAGLSDVFLAKYDAAGSQVWVEQAGSDNLDSGYGVAVDASGNVWVAGGTFGSFGGLGAGSQDAFLARYSSTGVLDSVDQHGTSATDCSADVVVDASGFVYLIGSTEGSLEGANTGGMDVFVAKLLPGVSGGGFEIWTTQFGSVNSDESARVVVDSSGTIMVAGTTTGDLGGANRGGSDAFVAAYDSTGNRRWLTQLGSSGIDHGSGVAVDGSGNVFVTGHAEGTLSGTVVGSGGAFLAKYTSAGNPG